MRLWYQKLVNMFIPELLRRYLPDVSGGMGAERRPNWCDEKQRWCFRKNCQNLYSEIGSKALLAQEKRTFAGANQAKSKLK